MKRILTICLAIAALTVGANAQGKKAAAAAKKLELKDLPPAVQKTIQDQSKGSEIKNINKETEDGKPQYEVETLLNGKHRDFNVDRCAAIDANRVGCLTTSVQPLALFASRLQPAVRHSPRL